MRTVPGPRVEQMVENYGIPRTSELSAFKETLLCIGALMADLSGDLIGYDLYKMADANADGCGVAA